MPLNDKPTQEWFTKFGSVSMGFRVDDSGMLPGWDIPVAIVERPIPGGGGRVDVQVMGNSLATATWQFWVDTFADLQALYALLGTRQTLVVFGRSQILNGTQVTRRGVPYVSLANTMLVAITDTSIEPSGVVEGSVTFRRAVDLQTLQEAV